MMRPRLTGRRRAFARLPECNCAGRLAAIEARLTVVEGLAVAAVRSKPKPRPGRPAAPAAVEQLEDLPRDSRGWPEGYEVEVRQF